MAKPEHDLCLCTLSFLINLPEAIAERDLWVHLIWMDFERFQMVPINSSGLSLRAPWQAYIKTELASVGKVGLSVNFFSFPIYLFILNLLEGQLVPEILARPSWLLRGIPYQYFLCLRVQFTFTWQQKKNFFMLANYNIYCCQHISVLGIHCPLGMAYFVFCYTYICAFPPEVRSRPCIVAQSGKLSLGRGKFRFICLEEEYGVGKGLCCWEVWKAYGEQEYVDGILSAGLVKTSCDPACFALCCLLDMAGWGAGAPAGCIFTGMVLPSNLTQTWQRKKKWLREVSLPLVSVTIVMQSKGFYLPGLSLFSSCKVGVFFIKK